MLQNLDKYDIILASNSPRRRELLADLGVKFRVQVIGGVDESYPASLPPLEIAQYIAQVKAQAHKSLIHSNELVITADTVVALDNRVLGKPAHAAEAREMLRALSGKTHKVITGVTVTTARRQEAFSAVTDVVFAPLDDDEIDYYVTRFSPLDKAGAYGIQEWIGCMGISHISGSFYNVMGLPLHRLYTVLKTF